MSNKFEETLYFAYGSNMNIEQMAFRCPDAQVVEAVRLNGYRLAFRGGELNAVATILPSENEHVDGVMWRITKSCEKSLNRYEGYPHLYGKQLISVENSSGKIYTNMVYVMNAPYKEMCGIPCNSYAQGILKGAVQNGIEPIPIKQAIRKAKLEYEISTPLDSAPKRKRSYHER